MTDTVGTPVAEGVFDERDGETVLLGSRCPRCGALAFPRRDSCANPACDGGIVEDAQLRGPGAVFTFTVQHYAPPVPFDLVDPPYAIVSVDLGDPVRVIGLYAGDPERVRVGEAVDLTTLSVRAGDRGQVTTWAFAPAASGQEDPHA